MNNTTFVVFLRGINVSGQKKIKMVELKSHLEELGYNNISTYIQSGNIMLTCMGKKPELVQKEIENKILEKYGFEVPTFVLEIDEIKQVLDNNPILKRTNIDPAKLYVTFLAEVPSPEKLQLLKDVDDRSEEYQIDGKVIFLHFPNGYGRAKLTNNFIESKLKVLATTRNWKTITTMYEIVVDQH